MSLSFVLQPEQRDQSFEQRRSHLRIRSCWRAPPLPFFVTFTFYKQIFLTGLVCHFHLFCNPSREDQRFEPRRSPLWIRSCWQAPPLPFFHFFTSRFFLQGFFFTFTCLATRAEKIKTLSREDHLCGSGHVGERLPRRFFVTFFASRSF